MKPSYQYIFDLIDFADDLYAKIIPSDPEIDNYFITLVYIEDLIDKYGRGLVYQSARVSGLDDKKAKALRTRATEKMDELRNRIAQLVKDYNFDETLDDKADQLRRVWHKYPPAGNDAPPIPWSDQ